MSSLRATDPVSREHLRELPIELFSLVVNHLTSSEVLALRVCSKALKEKVDLETSWKKRSICLLRSSYLSSMFPNFFTKEKIATNRSALFTSDHYKNEVNQFLEINSRSLNEFDLSRLLQKAAYKGDLEVVQKSLLLLPVDKLDHSAALQACAQSDFPNVLDWFISSSFFQRKNPQFLAEGLVASLKCRSDENFFKLFKILQEEDLMKNLQEEGQKKNRLYFSELICNSISSRHFKAFSLLLPLDREFATRASALFEVAKCTDPRFSTLFLEVFKLEDINEHLLEEAAQKSIMHGNKLIYDKTAPLLRKEQLHRIIKYGYPVAAKNGCLAMVDELFTEVVSRSAGPEILNLALQNGCRGERKDVVKLLLSQDKIQHLDKRCLNNALMKCAEKGNLDLFQDLFSSKDQGFFTSDILSRSLLNAFENESIEMVNLILSKDPDVKLTDCPYLNFNREIYLTLIERQKIDQRALLDIASHIISNEELDLIKQLVKNFSNIIDIEFAHKLLDVALEKGKLEILIALLSTERISATFEKEKWLLLFLRAIKDEKGEFVKQLSNYVKGDLEKEDLNKIIHALFKASSDAITSELPLYLSFFKIDPKQALFFLKENLNSVSDQAFTALLKNPLIAEDEQLISEILEELALEGSVEKVRAIFSTDACLSLKVSSILQAHANLMSAFKNGKSEAISGIDAMIISKRKDVLFLNYHIQQEPCTGYF